MKSFNIVVPTEVVATFTIGKKEFETRFGGIPSKLEAFIKERHPEYKSCSQTWTWDRPCLNFIMDFISSGEPVIEPVS